MKRSKQLIYPAGFDWDFYAFGVNGLSFLANKVINGGIKTILEVGCGLSSLLLSQLCSVVTLENNPVWANKVSAAKTKAHDLSVVLWNGVDWPIKGRFDAVFIDGPEEQDAEKYKKLRYAGIPREVSFINAVNHTDRIFVHDAARLAEAVYQISHLAHDFRVTDIIHSDEDPEIKRYLVAWKRIEPTKER